MRLTAAGVAVGMVVGVVVGAALALVCSVKYQQRTANRDVEPNSAEAETSGEAPESPADATPAMH